MAHRSNKHRNKLRENHCLSQATDENNNWETENKPGKILCKWGNNWAHCYSAMMRLRVWDRNLLLHQSWLSQDNQGAIKRKGTSVPFTWCQSSLSPVHTPPGLSLSPRSVCLPHSCNPSTQSSATPWSNVHYMTGTQDCICIPGEGLSLPKIHQLSFQSLEPASKNTQHHSSATGQLCRAAPQGSQQQSKSTNSSNPHLKTQKDTA